MSGVEIFLWIAFVIPMIFSLIFGVALFDAIKREEELEQVRSRKARLQARRRREQGEQA